MIIIAHKFLDVLFVIVYRDKLPHDYLIQGILPVMTILQENYCLTLDTDYMELLFIPGSKKTKQTHLQQTFNISTKLTPVTPSQTVDKYCTPAFQFRCRSATSI